MDAEVNQYQCNNKGGNYKTVSNVYILHIGYQDSQTDSFH